MTIVSTLTIWLLGVLAGSMLFFAITVAPTVFRSLPEAEAGRFLRAFFPRYYLWGLVLACLLTVVTISTSLWLTVICALLALLFIYARQILIPQINRARDRQQQGVTGANKQFQRLHLTSVLINGFQLLALLAISIYLALA